MPLNKFIPLSPDPNITRDSDMGMAQFGHLNTIVDYLNTYVAADSLQLDGTGPLSVTARYITDSAGNLSSLSISTGNIGIGTTNPIFKLSVNSGISGVASFIGNSLPTNFKSEISIGDIANSRGFNIGIDPFETGNNVLYFFSTETAHLPVAIKSQTLIIGNYDVSLPAGMDTATGLYMRVIKQAIFRTSGGLPILKLATDGTTQLGNETPMNARLGIKGSGSTSATTSLLVQNSGGTQLLKITDDGVVEGGSATATQFKILNKNGLAISRDANLDANIRILEFGGVGPVIKITGNSVPTFKFLDGSNYFCIQTSPDWTGIGQFTTVANSSALLQADSTTKGFLKPRLTTAQKNAIVTPAAGLEVYDTDLNRPCFYSGSAWVTL